MHKATTLLSAGVLLTLAATQALAITSDGTAEAAYGPALVIQTTQTQFGDASNGLVDFANGSEIDALFGRIEGGVLYLTVAGNLEGNFNKLELFFDTKAGGQNRLRGDNPDVDFNGLNRMGDDGSGNGLTFDAGFEPDYYITGTGGNGGAGYAMFASYAELLTSGGGAGYYLGTNTATTPGPLTGGTNPNGIEMTVNNSNIAGVGGGCDAASGAGVTTGVELAIPLAALGNPTGCIGVCAFINGSSHDFLANQVAGPLPAGTCNLGEPRAVNFGTHAGNQSATVCDGVTNTRSTTWGGLKTLYR